MRRTLALWKGTGNTGNSKCTMLVPDWSTAFWLSTWMMVRRELVQTRVARRNGFVRPPFDALFRQLSTETQSSAWLMPGVPIHCLFRSVRGTKPGLITRSKAVALPRGSETSTARSRLSLRQRGRAARPERETGRVLHCIQLRQSSAGTDGHAHAARPQGDWDQSESRGFRF